jgi:hypothetical protein
MIGLGDLGGFGSTPIKPLGDGLKAIPFLHFVFNNGRAIHFPGLGDRVGGLSPLGRDIVGTTFGDKKEGTTLEKRQNQKKNQKRIYRGDTEDAEKIISFFLLFDSAVNTLVSVHFFTAFRMYFSIA